MKSLRVLIFLVVFSNFLNTAACESNSCNSLPVDQTQNSVFLTNEDWEYIHSILLAKSNYGVELQRERYFNPQVKDEYAHLDKYGVDVDKYVKFIDGNIHFYYRTSIRHFAFVAVFAILFLRFWLHLLLEKDDTRMFFIFSVFFVPLFIYFLHIIRRKFSSQAHIILDKDGILEYSSLGGYKRVALWQDIKKIDIRLTDNNPDWATLLSPFMIVFENNEKELGKIFDEHLPVNMGKFRECVQYCLNRALNPKSKYYYNWFF